MVRSWWLATLAVAALAGSARAGPDWRGAGGAIFAPAPGEAAADSEAADGPVRVPAPEQPFAAEVAAAAASYQLDPKLLHALLVVESGYRPDAISSAGARGLAQLMPATARALGVGDLSDPDESVSAGAAYLARQLVRFKDVRLALAAYNAGPGRVDRLGHVPAIAETRRYVSEVLDCYLALASGRTVRSVRDCQAGSP